MLVVMGKEKIRFGLVTGLFCCCGKRMGKNGVEYVG